MFDNLIKFWNEYKAVIATKPYNGDNVQAQGLRFAAEWNARRDDILAQTDIISALEIEPDDLDYGKKDFVMKALLERF